MNKTRIVLRPELAEEVKELCSVTHAASPSELVTILITRYGRHLKETWEVSTLSVERTEFEPRPATLPDINLDDPIAL